MIGFLIAWWWSTMPGQYHDIVTCVVLFLVIEWVLDAWRD